MKKKFLGMTALLTTLSATSIFAASYISITQAKSIALKKVPGSTVTSIELDYEKNRAIYDIDLVFNQYEYDLKLDAKTGSGISITKELRDGYTSSNSQTTTFITRKQAKSAALAKVPGATVVKVELDLEDGVYEVELRKGYTEYDVDVNVYTGQVISVEIDD